MKSFSVKRCSERYSSKLNMMLPFPSERPDDQRAQGPDQSSERAG